MNRRTFLTSTAAAAAAADGRIWMKPQGVRAFAGDLPEAEQRIVWATHYAPDVDLFNQKVDGTS